VVKKETGAHHSHFGPTENDPFTNPRGEKKEKGKYELWRDKVKEPD